MPWFFVSWGRLSVSRWVWVIAESSLMLLESVSPLCFWLDIFFYLIFENVLVISFSTSCFEVSALGIFYLGDLLGCCLWVVADSEGSRVIFLLFISFNSKIQKTFFFLHSYAFFSYCISMVLALGFLGEYYSYFHIGMIAYTLEGKILHFM